MRRVRKSARWGAFLVVCLLAIVGPATIVYWRHTVPLSQCSEVYRRYHDLPGIQAAFIRDKQINDTLSLDMTLFVAEDSLSFINMLREMGKREELIADLMSIKSDENTRFSRECLRGFPEAPRDANPINNEVVSTFPVMRAVAVFHTSTEEEIKIVLHKNYFDEIDIN